MTVHSESDQADEESKTDFVSNPFSSGGGGVRFENQVQASFLAMMLVGGSPPVLVGESIQKIKLQGRYAGFHTDDLIIFTGNTTAGSGCSRLLAQIKHKVSFTRRDKLFKQAIKSAWKDWGNPECFTPERDAFAVITGPLSATDIAEVRVLLEWARHSESATEFFRKVELTNFSSDQKRDKLAVFRETVTESNGGIAVENHEFFSFLRHFHLLGYDLDIKAGVMHALLQSIIAPYAPDQSYSVWSMLLEEVQSHNQNSGTITVDTVARPLRKIFSERKYFIAPPDLITLPTPTLTMRELEFAAELTIANLLGQWHEAADRVVVELLIHADYESWTNRLNELLLLPNSPIALRDGAWQIRDRKAAWQETASRLTPATLKSLKAAVVSTLQDSHDSSADSSIWGSSISRHRYSRLLRRGLAESLVLLNSFPSLLKHCSPADAETATVIIVRDLLSNADCKQWSKLNDVLPLLAEASPAEFLDAIECKLKEHSDHFPKIFAQEAIGSNEMTGTLWGLETIAWNSEFLMRAAVVLAELAAIDPGGRWANRPFNSLVTMLLPWFPQTLAPFPKQVATVQTVIREQPDIGWRLLLSMMPSASLISHGTHRPAYRDWIPKDREPRVTTGVYGERVMEYARIGAEIACQNTQKLKDTFGFLRYMPAESLAKITESLMAANETLTNEDSFELWTALSEFLEQHRNADFENLGVNEEVLQSFAIAKDRLAPSSPMKLHRWLFNGDPSDHIDPDGDVQEQLSIFIAKQDSAISEILNEGGMKAMLQFAGKVASPGSVGLALGRSGPKNIDSILLPEWLGVNEKNVSELVAHFIQGRFAVQRFNWVDAVCSSKWQKQHIARFMHHLPFQKETWDRVGSLLGDDVTEYWSTVRVDPYNLGNEYLLATEQLLRHHRPAAALSCFRSAIRAKKDIPIDRLCKALLLATSEENDGDTNVRTTVELIKYLQRHPETPRKVLCDIEWKYLPILDDHHRASAVTLQSELAVNPQLFCQIIQSCFRSRNAVEPVAEATDEEKAIAGNAYYLLSRWRQLPGTEPDGSLSSFKLKDWLDRVLNECDASGHGEVARLQIGELFIHAPADPKGLWIHHTVAEALNAKDAESMRDGYRSGWFNSHGAHHVDPQGRPEKALAASYRSRAEDVENVGYQRLAQTLRDLADMYEREAQRIVDRYSSGGPPTSSTT